MKLGSRVVMKRYEAVDGWHVNVRTRDQATADALSGVAIEAPDTPARVFA